MSYSKKHKYIRKYLSKSGNMVYVYPVSDKNSNWGVTSRKKVDGIGSLKNKITGSAYKEAAATARSNAKTQDAMARQVQRINNFNAASKLSASAYKYRASKNRAAAREAERLYKTTTLAGAAKRAKNNTKESLRKLKRKTKLTISKIQNKVSKAIQKLSDERKKKIKSPKLTLSKKASGNLYIDGKRIR